jgi:hypothetical protein
MSPSFTFAAIAVLLVFGLILYFIFRPKRLPPLPAFLPEWRELLLQYVNFYQNLNAAERKTFETRMQAFLQRVTLTGIETEITEKDRVFIAASAIIPTFGFPRWNQYPKLEQNLRTVCVGVTFWKVLTVLVRKLVILIFTKNTHVLQTGFGGTMVIHVLLKFIN